MTIIKKMLKERAFYWEPIGSDENGRAIWETPIEIKCRWEDSAEEYMDRLGRSQTSNAMVYVDRELKEGGFLWYAPFVTLHFDDCCESLLTFDNCEPVVFGPKPDPVANQDAWEIKRVFRLPTLSARQFVRRVAL